MTALRNANPDEVGGDADPAEGRWSQAEMLLAAAVDEMRILRWLYVTAHSDKAKPEQPKPIRRPGIDGGKRKRRLNPAAAQFLFNHINGLPNEGPELTVIEGGGGA